MRIASKAIVQSWDEGTPYEKDDAGMVGGVEAGTEVRRVVRKGVKGGGGGKARDGCEVEGQESGVWVFIEMVDVKEGAEKVRVDVAGFIVKVCEGAEGGKDGVRTI